MKTVVINTSKEAQNTKLDILFRAPFGKESLLWLDGELTNLGEQAERIRQSLLQDVDTVDRDYQLIVLVDLYPFPYGNDRMAVNTYRMLLDKYIRQNLLLPLRVKHNLLPQAVGLYFLDSSRDAVKLDKQTLAANLDEQEKREREKIAEQTEKERGAGLDSDGNLTFAIPEKKTVAPPESMEDHMLKQIFGWRDGMKRDALTWTVKCSLTEDKVLDFSQVFQSTADAIANDSADVDAVKVAMMYVPAPVEGTNLGRIGNFSVRLVTFRVSRENEQSLMESLFSVFATIFTGVQKGELPVQPQSLTREEITQLLLGALKRYKYFSQEEKITVDYYAIDKIFEKQDVICKNRVEDSRKRMKDASNNQNKKTETDEQVAERIMGIKENDPEEKRSVDETFREMTERIFDNYDTEKIQAQNNALIKSCLEGLWKWRDEQTDESLITIIKEQLSAEEFSSKRELIVFREEDYEAHRAQLVEKVTETECLLAAGENVLLEAKKLALKYSDYMRKGKIGMISCIGAVFTVLATVFPFLCADLSALDRPTGMRVNLLLVIALCAGLYAIAAMIYMTFINRKKRELVEALRQPLERSEGERKESIMALHRYYNETVVNAETHYMLWREIRRRDRENAKKGIKRNYHIKRMKNLAAEIDRCITLLKLDVSAKDRSLTDADAKMFSGVTLKGECSCYDPANREAYCFLPLEENATEGETKE